MALIKCEECGKEVSDKAKVCVHCGCPIEIKAVQINVEEQIEHKEDNEVKITEYKDEKEVDRLKLDKKGITSMQILIVVIGLATLFSGGLGVIMGIICFAVAIICESYKRNELVLTNKRVKGKIGWLGSLDIIDIPLDRVDAITTNFNDLLKIESLQLSSNTKKWTVVYTSDASMFCDNVLSQIEKYKKYLNK